MLQVRARAARAASLSHRNPRSEGIFPFSTLLYVPNPESIVPTTIPLRRLLCAGGKRRTRGNPGRDTGKTKKNTKIRRKSSGCDNGEVIPSPAPVLKNAAAINPFTGTPSVVRTLPQLPRCVLLAVSVLCLLLFAIGHYRRLPLSPFFGAASLTFGWSVGKRGRERQERRFL